MKITVTVRESLEHEVELDLDDEAIRQEVIDSGYDPDNPDEVHEWGCEMDPDHSFIVDSIGDDTVIAVTDREVRGAHVEE